MMTFQLGASKSVPKLSKRIRKYRETSSFVCLSYLKLKLHIRSVPTVLLLIKSLIDIVKDKHGEFS